MEKETRKLCIKLTWTSYLFAQRYQGSTKPPSQRRQFTTSKRISIFLEISIRGLDLLRSLVDWFLWVPWLTACKSTILFILFKGFSLKSVSDWLRVPAVPFFAFNVLCWGILEMCMAACTSFGGLFACRFLLGGFESLLIPAVTLVVSMWYRPEEQPKRNRYHEPPPYYNESNWHGAV